MIIIDYKPKFHKQIVHACAEALKEGKVVAYPTDTSYGLAADAANDKAILKLYKIKERDFHKPVHIVVPSLSYAKKVARWNVTALKLAKKFWPGALTLVLPLKSENNLLKKMSAGTGTVGLRCPKHMLALDLAKTLNSPITATSANPSANLSGGYDSYSAEDVVNQFVKKKYQPDIVINAGRLPKRRPSTIVKITGKDIEILRQGPVSEREVRKVLGISF